MYAVNIIHQCLFYEFEFLSETVCNHITTSERVRYFAIAYVIDQISVVW